MTIYIVYVQMYEQKYCECVCVSTRMSVYVCVVFTIQCRDFHQNGIHSFQFLIIIFHVFHVSTRIGLATQNRTHFI